MDAELTQSEPSVSHCRPRRLALLFAWLGLLTLACGAFWLSSAAQDYKNTVLQVSVLLGVLGLSIWTVRSSGLPRRKRWLLALAEWAPIVAVMPPLGPIELINNGNNGIAGWRWRWSTKPDERLAVVARAGETALEWKTSQFDYPGFLGNGYWAEVKGIELDPDWSAHLPKTLWRKPIGAGWSGYAIVGDYAVTQEQRGEQELVVCYDIRTGEIA